jgi:predicted dehydrogenase
MAQEAKPIRIVVIGVGGMGGLHVRNVADHSATELVGVCDSNEEVAGAVASRYRVPWDTSWDALFDRVRPDACIVATPHAVHEEPARAAFSRGVHTLVLKPLTEQVGTAERLVSAYETARTDRPGLVFATSYTLRLFSHYARAKELLSDGVLGRLQRCDLVSTQWFRTDAYFRQRPWRGTWAGEGGGVLLNQSVHHLDLYQWLVGTPSRLFAQLALGKYHHIEVDDEVTLLLEHDNGMVGRFTASSAEWPGTERLEIVGEHGRMVCREETLELTRLSSSSVETIRNSEEGFARIAVDTIRPDLPPNPGHDQVFLLRNFVEAIRHGEAPISPGVEGIHSLEMANAAVLSHMKQSWQVLPVDREEYRRLLARLSGSTDAETPVEEEMI